LGKLPQVAPKCCINRRQSGGSFNHLAITTVLFFAIKKAIKKMALSETASAVYLLLRPDIASDAFFFPALALKLWDLIG
jgi:hypothetical protein